MTELSKNVQVPQCDKTAVKSRFFAQYWGTKTLYIGGVGLVELGNGGWNLKHPDFFLQLKPLSKITDEDAMVIQKITGANHLPKQPLIYACLKKSDAIPVIDYLRSKGYAVPFMEYSVEDLIEFDWVRLV